MFYIYLFQFYAKKDRFQYIIDPSFKNHWLFPYITAVTGTLIKTLEAILYSPTPRVIWL